MAILTVLGLSLLLVYPTLSITTLSINDTHHNSIDGHCSECRYDDCHNYLNGMLSVIMLNVIMLNVLMLNVLMLNVLMLNVLMLNVIMLIVIMLNVDRLNVRILNVTMLNVVKLRVVRLIAIRLNVVILSVIWLIVITLNVVRLSVVRLNVFRLNVVRLSVVAPRIRPPGCSGTKPKKFLKTGNRSPDPTPAERADLGATTDHPSPIWIRARNGRRQSSLVFDAGGAICIRYSIIYHKGVLIRNQD
jgi:hypothetical protein